MSGKYTRGLGLIRQAFYLGIISISLQVVLARLAVSFAGGNEVYLSFFFALWLIFTGIGAFVIKKPKPELLFVFLGICCLLFPSLYYLAPKIFGFLSGQLIPLWAYVLISAAIAFPICLLNGGLFSVIAIHIKGESKPGKAYWSETLGALFGGIAATVFYYLGGRDYSFLLGIAILCLFFVPLKARMLKLTALIISLMTIFLGLGNHIEDKLLTYHYKPFQYKGSASGRLVRYDAVRTGEITSVYSGGTKAADIPDYAASSELFYWPFLVKPEMGSIAFIGAEMNDFDSMIPDSVKAYFIFADDSWRELADTDYLSRSYNSIVSDPVDFMRKDECKFDAIVLNLGPLLSLYNKRLETEYFLVQCRDHLHPDGILCLYMDSYRGIWRDDLKKRLNNIYGILKNNYNDVALIPGDRLILIASDSVNYDLNIILEKYKTLGIDSPYFNEALIRSRLNPFNLKQTLVNLESEYDQCGPLEIGYGLSYHFSQMGDEYILLKALKSYTIAAIIVILILSGIFSGKGQRQSSIHLVNIAYFGAASFALELLAMYKIQLLGGYLYLALGVMIGLFMLGMASGSLWGTYLIESSNLPKTNNKGLPLAMAIMAILSMIFYFTQDSQVILLIIIGLAGFGGGLGFATGAGIFNKKPGLPYGFDLLGGVLGTIVGLSVLAGGFDIGSALLGILSGGIILLATNRVLLKY